jgi:hypothetical protein
MKQEISLNTVITPPSLLSNGYQELFPWGQSGWSVKLTIHLRLVALHFHLPNTPLWRGAQLKKSTGITLNFTFYLVALYRAGAKVKKHAYCTKQGFV